MKMVAYALSWVRKLRRYVDRPWYPVALAGLTLIDFFVVVIPSDGIVVASAMARPKRWFSLAVAMSVGSLIGGLLLAELTRHFGEAFVSWVAPGLLSSETWQVSESWLEHYGVWALLVVAASPLAQQPCIFLAGLTDMPIGEIGFALGLGRLIKFLSYAWIASHAPKLVAKIPALRGELEEVEPPVVVSAPSDDSQNR